MADMLSQDEINALLGNSSDSASSVEETSDDVIELTQEQINILTEIGNETMSVSAKTLENNLRQTVSITDPLVEKCMLSEATNKFNESSLGVRIEYKVGVEGSNVLVLGFVDAKVIANLMQGGSGETDPDDNELSMIDESALCEAMNQMVGSSSTVLFKILGEKVDIDTPKLFNLNLDSEIFIKDFGFDEDVECIISSFPLKIGDLIDSYLVQIMPASFAGKLIESYSNKKPDTLSKVQDDIRNFENSHTHTQEAQVQHNIDDGFDSSLNYNTAQTNPNVQMQDVMYQMNPNMNMQYQQQNMQGQMMGGMPMQNGQYQASNNINYNTMNAKPAQFQSFDFNEVVQQKENINIIMDVPLEVTVEMGRTVKKIEEILEFSPGTIIELDKLAGDPIDILVNGKFVAKGEVVVIDENYGIRITDITNFKNRI